MMEKEEWKRKYIDRLVARGLDLSIAKIVFEGGLDDHDYDEDPEDCADEELSYWQD